MQRYSDHAWRDYVTSGCLALDSTSTAAYRFHGAPSYVSHSWRIAGRVGRQRGERRAQQRMGVRPLHALSRRRHANWSPRQQERMTSRTARAPDGTAQATAWSHDGSHFELRFLTPAYADRLAKEANEPAGCTPGYETILSGSA